ncbi:hypothetical protein [Collimonas arenae]
MKPNSGRYWRMKYIFDGKKKLLSFDVYPEVCLMRQATTANRAVSR